MQGKIDDYKTRKRIVISSRTTLRLLATGRGNARESRATIENRKGLDWFSDSPAANAIHFQGVHVLYRSLVLA